MTIDPALYNVETVINIGGEAHTIITGHNTISPVLADQLLSVNSTTGEINGGMLEGILDWLNATDHTDASSAMIDNFNESLNDLKELLRRGINDGQGNIHYPSVGLARDIESLLKTIESISSAEVGWNDTYALTKDNLFEWYGLSQVNTQVNNAVEGIRNSVFIEPTNNNGAIEYNVVPAVGSVQAKGSLQSMIELIYVKRGNQLLADNLESLESALGITKDSLDSLNILQNLHNNAVVYSPGSIPFNLLDNLDDETVTIEIIQGLADEYDAAADSFYTAPVPELGPGLANLKTLLDERNDIITQMYSEIYDIDLRELTDNFEDYATGINSGAISTDDLIYLENWTNNIQEYNLITSKIMKQMEPFNAVLNGNVDLDGITEAFPYENFYRLPVPEFRAVEVASGVRAGSSLANRISQWVTEMNNTDFAIIDTDGTIKENRIGLMNGTGTNGNFSYTVDEFVEPLYGLPIIESGDPSNGISKHPMAKFYDDIISQRQTLIDTIQTLKSDPNQSDTNSLANTLQRVLDDINSAGFDNMVSAVNAEGSFTLSNNNIRNAIELFAQNWVIDKNDTIASSDATDIGRIQNNLGVAISAAQSLNDTQKEETRRALFIFEEFYKSASAMLNKITQILEKLAQGINR